MMVIRVNGIMPHTKLAVVTAKEGHVLCVVFSLRDSRTGTFQGIVSVTYKS